MSLRLIIIIHEKVKSNILMLEDSFLNCKAVSLIISQI